MNIHQLFYTNAGIKHNQQPEAVFDFVDFWTQGQGVAPKLLIFESKFTTYQNLDKLNKSKEKIKFITLRRRGKNSWSRPKTSPQPNGKRSA